MIPFLYSFFFWREKESQAFTKLLLIFHFMLFYRSIIDRKMIDRGEVSFLENGVVSYIKR